MSDTETQTAESTADVDTTNVDVNVDAENSDSNIPGEIVKDGVMDGAADGEKPEVEAAPAFTPNFKYKAALQEKELDEFWRPLIKDADSQEKVIKAMQKLDGFDKVLESREKIASDYKSLETDYHAAQSDITRFNDSVGRGDLTSAFRQAGLTDQQVFQWTQQRLQMMELPPEQRRALEESEQIRQKQWEMEQENSQYKTLYESQSVQNRTMHLDFVLSQPQVAASSQNWDNAMGQGAFKGLVVSEAQNHFHRTGEDLPADQAVHMVLQKFGGLLNQSSQQPGGPQAPSAQTNPQTKPVIPNVSGKNASPIKKAVKSIDDIKRIAKEMDQFG